MHDFGRITTPTRLCLPAMAERLCGDDVPGDDGMDEDRATCSDVSKLSEKTAYEPVAAVISVASAAALRRRMACRP